MYWKNTLILASLLLTTSCTQLIFQPHQQHYSSPDRLGLIHEEVNLKSQDNLILHGWWLPSSGETKATILFLHGNAENISTHFHNIAWLPKEGYNVFLFDYRGYGKSEGTVDLAGSIADIETAIAYTLNKRPQDQSVIVVGHSLGASMGIHAIAHSPDKEQIAAAVLVSAFADYRKVSREILSHSPLLNFFSHPLSWTISNRYRPDKVIAQLSPLPLYLLHSKDDEIIPPHHADTLFAAAREPKRLTFISGRHNQLFSLEENRKLLLRIFDEVLYRQEKILRTE